MNNKAMTSVYNLLLLLLLTPSSLQKAHASDTSLTHRPTRSDARRRLVDTPIDLDNLAGPAFPNYAQGNCANADVMTVNFGYYQSWATYREEDCNPVGPGDIDPFGYTHLAYSFAWINANYELEPYNAKFEEEERLYREFVGLKKINPDLKTLITVGGWTFSNPGPTERLFSNMCDTPENRAIFVASTVAFCQKHGFDGLDLDWEFPGDYGRGGKPEDKQNYAQLVFDLRAAFDAAPEHLELSMAIPISRHLVDPGYDLPALANGLDFMNLMTYNIHGNWNEVVGSHTDLPDIFDFLQYFLDQGVPPNKILLGFAPYARTYTMTDLNCLTYGCPFIRSGPGGCQNTGGFMTYYSIDERVQSGDYDSITPYNPSTASAELVFDDVILVDYDSPQSFDVKAMFARDACFRGVMWWAVDMLQEPLVSQIEFNPAPPTPNNPLPPDVVNPSTAVDPTNPPVVSPTDAPAPAPTDVPVFSPTDAPVLPVTDAPIPAATEAPVPAATEAPAVPATDAPVPVATEAPVVPPTDNPIELSPTEAPAEPVTGAPVVQVTASPFVPPISAPAISPTGAPVVPATEAPAPMTWAPVPIAPIGGLILPRNLRPKRDRRCGISEYDARGNCKKLCDDDANSCDEGEFCWGTFANYCHIKPEGHPVCDDLDKAEEAIRRCGFEEDDARGFCGKSCENSLECGKAEFCFPVQLNFCNCYGMQDDEAAAALRRRTKEKPTTNAEYFEEAREEISPYFLIAAANDPPATSPTSACITRESLAMSLLLTAASFALRDW